MNALRTMHFETVFEIGCGYGRITKAILQQFPNVKIQAIDLSPQQIRIARRCMHVQDLAKAILLLAEGKNEEVVELMKKWTGK